MPWGVAEARLLELDGTLERASANPLPFWDSLFSVNYYCRRVASLRNVTALALGVATNQR